MFMMFNERNARITSFGKGPLLAFITRGRDHVPINLTIGERAKSFRIPTKYYKQKVKRLATMLNPLPIYYVVDSIDCDHCRSVSAGRAANGYQYLKARDNAYCWAEGPTSVCRISKKDFEGFQSYQRDYILEAFEDGHPHSVHY